VTRPFTGFCWANANAALSINIVKRVRNLLMCYGLIFKKVAKIPWNELPAKRLLRKHPVCSSMTTFIRFTLHGAAII
jgi:hypothetical protein